jgi:ATP-dependent DNA ligase
LISKGFAIDDVKVGFDWTDRYPLIRDAVAGLPARSATIDGEAVYCDDAAIAIFEKMHSRSHDDRVFLCAFDLLDLDGEDWRPRPLRELGKILAKPPAGIQFSEHLEGDGATIFAHAWGLLFCASCQWPPLGETPRAIPLQMPVFSLQS